MQSILDRIAARQHVLRGHGYFDALRVADTDPAEHLQSVTQLTFWVLAFQDILRVNAGRAAGTAFAEAAERHWREDLGHDRWYLADVRRLGLDLPSAADLFSDEQRPARDASYRIMAAALTAEHPETRLTLLMAIEGTGHVFFDAVAALVAGTDLDRDLRYFSSYHLRVEKAHDMFQPSTEDYREIHLSPEARLESAGVVDTVFETVDGMLASMMTARRSEQVIVLTG